jgi:hypothetical protein
MGAEAAGEKRQSAAALCSFPLKRQSPRVRKLSEKPRKMTILVARGELKSSVSATPLLILAWQKVKSKCRPAELNVGAS